MKIRFYTVLFLLSGILALTAQDIHFSQFYASPLTLNPALTGNFNGLYRIGLIYRSQYGGLTDGKPAFSTPSVGLDFSLLRNKIKGGALGVGLVFVNDQQNGKTFNNNHILVSLAYNMGFGAKKAFQMGVGFQGGILLNKLNYDQLHLSDGYVQDNSSPTGFTYNQTTEAFTKGKAKGEFNAGVFLKEQFSDKIRAYVGYSFNNATHYKEDFVVTNGSGTYKFNHPFRNTIHGGVEFDIKDKAVLIPGFLYQNQAKANETNFGLTVGFHVIKDPAKRATLYLGFWNRLNTGDYTVIPKIGFEWKGFRAGFAYDNYVRQTYKGYTKTDGTTAAKMPQAFEITLSYVGSLFVPKEDNYLFNPRY